MPKEALCVKSNEFGRLDCLRAQSVPAAVYREGGGRLPEGGVLGTWSHVLRHERVVGQADENIIAGVGDSFKCRVRARWMTHSSLCSSRRALPDKAIPPRCR